MYLVWFGPEPGAIVDIHEIESVVSHPMPIGKATGCLITYRSGRIVVLEQSVEDVWRLTSVHCSPRKPDD